MTNEQTYQAMIQANPEVLRMVEDLDLRNPQTGLPYGVEVISEENRRKLSSIAQGLLNRSRIYTSEQVVSLIEEKLRVSRQRAVNGFEMMISSGVLTRLSGMGIRLSM